MKKIMIGLMIGIMLLMPFAAAAGKQKADAPEPTLLRAQNAEKSLEPMKATVKEIVKAKIQEAKAMRVEIKEKLQQRKQERSNKRRDKTMQGRKH